MRSLTYFIREALSNSRKNFSTTLGAMITIFLSLLVVGVLMVLSLIIYQLVDQVESRVSITIFIHDNAIESDVSSLEDYVKSLPEVDTINYIDKATSLERFKEQSTTAAIAEALDGNPLPASFEITLSEPEKIQQVVDQIMAYDSFPRVIDRPDNPNESINYGEDIVDTLITVANIIRFVCLALVLLLIFVALIFINNTIRLAILARRKEIAIMRLVGASNGFIRGPFLMESALQALVGVGLAVGSIALICRFLYEKTQSDNMLQWLPNITPQLWMIYLVLLAVGLVIGLFGSIWAMRRYLKV